MGRWVLARRRLRAFLGAALFLSLVSPVGSPLGATSPATAAPAANACSPSVAARAGIQVTPSHGNAFYIDSSQNQNIDASFVGYQVHVQSGAAIKSGLWISLENFSGGSVGLANPLDGQQVLKTFAGNDTQTAFFLLKATKPTTAAQGHTVKIYKAPPNLATASDMIYECQYTFSRVRETIKANPNKVTSVTVNPISNIGETFTVIVEGNTGTVGDGGSPDFDAMWLSPAPRSSFPTRALKLVGTRLTLSVGASSSTYTDQLLVAQLKSKIQGLGNVNTKKASYSATYTFQVMGKTPAAVPMIPIAQISSGQQMKHTNVASVEALNRSANLTSVSYTNINISKTQDSATSIGSVVGSYIKVPYLVTLNNSGSGSVTIDKVMDVPSANVHFDSTTAITLRNYTSASAFNSTTILGTSTSASGQITIPGPITIAAGRKAEIRYSTLIPICSSGTETFDNTARAYIGDAILGSSQAGYVPKTSVTQTCGSDTVTAVNSTEALPIDVQTLPASNISINGATLNGVIDSNGDSGKSIVFEYGTSPSSLNFSTSPSNVSLTTSSADPVPVLITVSSLNSGTVYYFRVKIGSVVGQTLSFVTTEPVGTPTVQTDSATGVSDTSPFAFLNGTVDPNGNLIYVSFSVSTSPTLASDTRTVMLTDDPSAALNTNDQVDAYNDYVILEGSFPQQVSIKFSDFTRSRSAADVTGVNITPTNNQTYYYRLNYHTSAGATSAIVASGEIRSFTVKLMQNQTIEFPTISDRIYDPNVTNTVSLPVETSSVNLALTYSSEDPSVCTVSLYTVTIHKAGTCILTASQPGNSTYNPADPVSRSFLISKAAQSISLADSSVIVSETITLSAAGGSGSGTVSYSSDSIRCSISGNVLTGNSVGTCNVTAVKGADDNFEEAQASAIISVRNRPTAVTGDVASESVTTTSAELVGSFNPNASIGVNATASVDYSLSSNLSSSSSAILSSTSTGSGFASLPVVSAATGLTTATLYFYRVKALRGVDLGTGATKSFVTLPDTPSNVTVTPGSNSASVAFTGVNAGDSVTIVYTVTCAREDGSGSTSNTGSASPIVVEGLSSLTDYKCSVKANSSASGAGGGGFGGLSSSSLFTTSIAKTSRVIKLFGVTSSDRESQTVSMIYGETLSTWVAFESNTVRSLRAGGDSGNGVGDGLLTYTAYGSYCQITKDGSSETATVSFTRVGTCEFKVSVRENDDYSGTSSVDSLIVTVNARVLTVTASSHVVSYGDTVPTLSSTVTGFAPNENSSNALGYTAPTCVTTYTNTTSAGTTGVTVICDGGAATNYLFEYDTGYVTINKANQTVSLAALSNMNINDTNQATSTTNDKSQPVSLSTSDATICDIVGSAVRAKAVGNCTVSASSAGDTNFNPSNVATRTFSITTTGSGNNDQKRDSGNSTPVKQNPTITWEDPEDIFSPTPLGATQLNAVGSVPGVLVYSPVAGTVLPVGRHTLSVTLNPTDSATYNSVSTTVRIRVIERRFQTVLTWQNPASIVYPTPLSATQLNARANTGGRFTYTPALGTILDPGTHTLNVDFIPTLSRLYQAASTQVTIVVTGTIPQDRPKIEEIKPTAENPIVVDTRPATTPGNSNQGNNQNPGNSNQGNNQRPNTPAPRTPVILVDTKTVSSVEVTDKGKGVTNAEVKDGKVEIAVAPVFSGKTSVEVTYVQNNETKVVILPLVIPPTPPTEASSSPESMKKSTISWAASPNALSYDVYVRENLECQVETTSCEVPFIVGPATPIRVVAIGGDDTKSEIEPAFKQEKVIPALTVNFATASFRLSAAFKRELRDLAAIIAREGFSSLVVYGHTDSRAFDNRTLSRNRAQATRDYLAKLLPEVEFKVAGFAATQRVAEENSRAGLAENRRAEVRIAG